MRVVFGDGFIFVTIQCTQKNTNIQKSKSMEFLMFCLGSDLRQVLQLIM
jgi:hypothetical protein